MQTLRDALLRRRIQVNGKEYDAVVHMCLERIKGPREHKGATVFFQDCKMAFDNAEGERSATHQRRRDVHIRNRPLQLLSLIHI